MNSLRVNRSIQARGSLCKSDKNPGDHCRSSNKPGKVGNASESKEVVERHHNRDQSCQHRQRTTEMEHAIDALGGEQTGQTIKRCEYKDQVDADKTANLVAKQLSIQLAVTLSGFGGKVGNGHSVQKKQNTAYRGADEHLGKRNSGFEPLEAEKHTEGAGHHCDPQQSHRYWTTSL